MDIKLYAFNVGETLRAFGFSRNAYCRDIFADPDSPVANPGLQARFTEILADFTPDIVISTSKNRYLETLCKEQGLPLICIEMGPLPRLGFPAARNLTIAHPAQHL